MCVLMPYNLNFTLHYLADMYRKVKAKSNALGAMSNFAIGGNAMSKPFSNGIMPKSDVVITVEHDEATKTGMCIHLFKV